MRFSVFGPLLLFACLSFSFFLVFMLYHFCDHKFCIKTCHAKEKYMCHWPCPRVARLFTLDQVISFVSWLGGIAACAGGGYWYDCIDLVDLLLCFNNVYHNATVEPTLPKINWTHSIVTLHLFVRQMCCRRQAWKFLWMAPELECEFFYFLLALFY